MRLSVPMNRVAIAGLVLIAVAAGSGCSWFRKNNKLYAQSSESRPLEVPPDLDLPRTDAAIALPASTSVMAPAAPAAGTGIGFTAAGSRDEVFSKVGDALGAIEGVTVASRAQLLGAFDVGYQGSNFLVRVSAADAGAYVSAVDPRGLPASGDAPVKLIAALKTALGGN
ncbi:MAG TPA: hypothetical protein VGD21_09965 [Lysobacter sp.]